MVDALVVEIGGGRQRFDGATSPVIAVGRSRDCEVTIDDERVSRRHLEARFDGVAWTVADVSSGGSFLGDAPLTPSPVTGPMEVRLVAADGPIVRFAIEAVPDPVAAPAPPASAPAPYMTAPTPPVSAPLPAAPSVPPGFAPPVVTADGSTVALDDRALRLRSPGGAESVFPPGRSVTVGRDAGCDVVIDDSLVSRHHLRFDHDGSRWMVADVGSTRGTFVDGRKMTGAVRAEGSFSLLLGAVEGGAELGVITAGTHRRPKSRLPTVALVGVGVLLIAVAALSVWMLTRPSLPDPETVVASVPLVIKYDQETGEPSCSGSGTVIAEDLILTNFHVVADAPAEDYPDMPCGIGPVSVLIGDDQQRDFDEELDAEIVAVDSEHDLAVLRVEGLDAPVIELADSEVVRSGAEIRILGYPTVGGTLSLTVTDGIISGVLDEDGPGPGAWLKTDALVTHGNSGGAAFDEDGRLVGVPTGGRSDDGGFINYLRPVHLAQSLIEDAEGADPIEPGDPLLSMALLDRAEGKVPDDGGDDDGGGDDSGGDELPAGDVVALDQIIGIVDGDEVDADPDLPSGVTELQFVVTFAPTDTPADYELELEFPSGDIATDTGSVDETGSVPITYSLNDGSELPDGTYVFRLAFEGTTVEEAFDIGG